MEAGPQQLAGNNRGFSRDPAIEVQEPTRHLAETRVQEATRVQDVTRVQEPTRHLAETRVQDVTRVQEATRVQEVTPSPGLSPVHWRPDSTPNLARSRGASPGHRDHWEQAPASVSKRCYSLFMYRINI